MGRFLGGGAAVLLLSLGASSIVVLGGGEAGGAIQQPRIVSATGDEPAESTTEHLACTRADEPANFPVYSLGSSFDDLPLTAVLRQCENPGLDASLGIDARGNSVSYIYGACDPPLGEGGCAPPLEIQVWPACERSVSDYDMDLPPRLDRLRGAPTAEIAGRVEIYSNSTIVVFSPDPELARRAAAAVQPLAANSAPSNIPPVTEKRDSLPPPDPESLSGKLECVS